MSTIKQRKQQDRAMRATGRVLRAQYTKAYARRVMATHPGQASPRPRVKRSHGSD